jgi:O-antigen/teichoic acid export membrane protein
VFDLLRRYVEAILVRAAPGLINVAALILIGGWLAPAEYGSYSTTLATTNFASTVIFGSLTFSVVSQHARLQADGLSGVYESSLVSAVLLIAALITAVGLAGMAIGLVRWAWIAPVVAFGVYTAVQEILRARLRLWAFGAAALSQAVVFMALGWLFVRRQPESSVALMAFAASYAFASIISLAFSGMPQLRWPDVTILSGTLNVGRPYTVSLAAEHALYLGMRYLIRFLGTAHHLGVFSFCVDLAQRFIGFLINAAGFSIIPAAFKADAKSGSDAFRRTLVMGSAVAVGLAIASFAAVLIVRATGKLPALSGSLFDLWVFAIVSSAIVVNRLKKLLIDPFAMRAQRASVIAVGYWISTPLTLASGALAITTGYRGSAEIVYLGGYVLAALITVMALRRKLLEQRGP